jgi:hypothetical protein
MTPTVLADIAVPETIIAQTHPPDGFVLRWMQQVSVDSEPVAHLRNEANLRYTAYMDTR